MMRRSAWKTWLLGLVVVSGLALWAAVWSLNRLGDDDVPAQASAVAVTPELIARGAYLAQVGNCAGCHTRPGAPDYAGGVALTTPFGTLYSSNLTPHPLTGLGDWSADDFWRALHLGRSRDGRLLYPGFPYTNTTLVTRADSDALWAFLRSLAPSSYQPPAHALRFPFNTQAALAVWRALYFRPTRFQPDPARSSAWNQGAYLVRGLAHCNACHASRNALGAVDARWELGGGQIPGQGWYAPSLHSAGEASVVDWPAQTVVDLLKTGVSDRGIVQGPMAEVVYQSTQHWHDDDLRAAAEFLQSLPQAAMEDNGLPAWRRQAGDLARGRKLYQDLCADCHGEQGQGGRVAGQASGAPVYPALAGNRAVTLPVTTNLVRMLRSGGFAPGTAGNPRPYGMPPFELNADDSAALLNYIRNAWGNQADAVAPVDVSGGR